MIKTREQILVHLDDLITFWRRKRDTAQTDQEKLIATCYVDAYQSVRLNIFDALLPPILGKKD